MLNLDLKSYVQLSVTFSISSSCFVDPSKFLRVPVFTSNVTLLNKKLELKDSVGSKVNLILISLLPSEIGEDHIHNQNL